MWEQSHGQYYAEALVLDASRRVREPIQEGLHNGEAQNWRIIGASDVPASSGGTLGLGGTRVGGAEASAEQGTSGRAVIILFWDTQRPSFARNTG